MFKHALQAFINSYIRLPTHRGKARAVCGLSRLSKDMTLLSRYGVYMLSAPDSTTAMSLIGGYNDVYEALDILEDGDLFIDVGANAGVFSLVAAKAVGQSGRVVAFEPSPVVFSRLTRNLTINHLDNVFPFQAALTDHTGLCRFDSGVSTHTGGAHLTESGSLIVLGMGDELVIELLKAIGGDRRTIIKIDVEGAELLVLRTLSRWLLRPQTTRIVVEVSEAALARFGKGQRELYEFMDQVGFYPRRRLSSSFFNEVFDRID
jgi:FkbM family methyltransferase